MCPTVSFVIPILETLAAHVPLPTLLYMCEIADDGAVIAGVELELPTDSVSLLPDRTLLKFLQGGYGFVIRDYGFHSVGSYHSGAVLVLRTLAMQRKQGSNSSIA